MALSAAVACVDTGAPDRAEVTGDAAAAHVPIELAGPGGAALLVPVHLNGEGPHDFILDTGATMTCVDAELAESLELEEEGGRLGMGVGVGQELGSVRVVRIDSLRVGESVAEGISACALDLEQFRSAGLDVRGLLGLNFLKSFRMTLDFEEGRLELEER